MPLKLMFITNSPEIALVAQDSGVDRIFVDLETLGKAERQGGMDTVQSHHTVSDISRLRPLIHTSELLVRVNPIHTNSAAEIDAVIQAGADIVMLPFFQNVTQVKTFISLIAGRARTCLLVETPEAVSCIDDILAIPGVDECHIGLNDLHLGYHLPFMFQLLANGMVDKLCAKFRAAGKPYGFGGFGRPGTGLLPAEYIIGEHYRLGSSLSILSRTFCDLRHGYSHEEIQSLFQDGVHAVRQCEKRLQHVGASYLEKNHLEVCRRVSQIVKELETS